ncbi:MAG: alpha-amylase family glycosyl hydrolase, partial [Bacteroidota bacterium]
PLVLQSLEPGTHWIKALAEDGNSVVSDSVAIYLRGPVMEEELPEGVVNGINYINNTTVTLVLHDPAGLKQFVFAIGDYSNWLPADENYMKRTPDGTRFWVTLEGLEPDTEYAFQYYIDGNMRLPDAYAEKILDPWNDRWIPSTTYPNLKEYPFEKTTGIVSIMHPGRQEYQWEVPDFTPVAINETQQDLVVYELLIRDFVESRHITDVTDKLDYLQDLGVNAIQLMPVMEFDGNESWGYAPNFFFATDKYYGTREAYKQFIDECHKRDIAVILDVVPNHAFGQNPMVNMYFDATAGEFGQPMPENPWFNQQAPHPFSVGYDFNHEVVYVREFFKRVLEYWLTEFNVDGFRIDLSKGLTQNFSGSDMGAWSAYDQSRINILTDYYNHIKSVKPNAYVILEHFASNDEETVLANTGMLLWGAVHKNYQQIAMGYQQDSDISWAYHGNRGWSFPNIVDYMENHDEERLLFEALSFGNASDDYNLKDTLTALSHQHMAAALFFGIPGPKMIWQFGEIGYDYSIFYGGDRTAPKPPRWDYWNESARQDLHRVYNAMIQLRNSDAFRFGQFSHDFGSLGKRAWVSHESMNVVIAGNMGVTGFDMAPGFQHGGTWYNYFTGETIEVSDPGNHSFYFSPGDFKVFTNTPLPRPFFHFNITVRSEQDQTLLADALVSIERAGSRFTTNEGQADFTLLQGEFTIDVSLEGYNSYQGSLVVNDDLDLTVFLTPGDDVNVDEPLTNTSIQVYPNPADDRVMIEARQGDKIDIYNLEGRRIHTTIQGSEPLSVDTSLWPVGVYMIRAAGRNETRVVKLIVK